MKDEYNEVFLLMNLRLASVAQVGRADFLIVLPHQYKFPIHYFITCL